MISMPTVTNQLPPLSKCLQRALQNLQNPTEWLPVRQDAEVRGPQRRGKAKDELLPRRDESGVIAAK